MSAYQSKLPEGTVVIDDYTDLNKAFDKVNGAGLIPRDYKVEPVGAYGRVMADDLYIPEDQWLDRLEVMEREKSGLFDLCAAGGLDPLHQGRTSSCWAQGVTDVARVTYLKEFGMKIMLSPASIAGPINGYRDRGGWGSAAHKFGRENGWCLEDLWPPNAVTERRYNTSEVDEQRAHFRIAEWGDAPSRDLNALLSLCFQGVPTAGAYNYMRHLVTPIQPVHRNGEWGVLCRNSGLGRDRTGHTVLMGRRAIPDELTFIYAMTPPGDQ